MLIGLQLYDADAVTAARQTRAVDALCRLAGVEGLNLQFKDGPQATSTSLENVPVLSGDSIGATGTPGKRKPLAREVFDVLAVRAAAGGHRRFAFINADIIVTAAAVAEVDRLDRESYVISRSDVDDVDRDAPSGLPMSAGLDMFVVSTAWWPKNRRRFRQYIVGETCWDNVFTSLLLCHSDGVVLNREALILHERHAPTWHDPTPAARYNGMLAALDARYFSIWARYWEQLEALRARGGSAADEEGLQRRAFTWQPSAYQAARQVVRSIRAKRGYEQMRAGWTAQRA
jgi:hypothetical protein